MGSESCLLCGFDGTKHATVAGAAVFIKEVTGFVGVTFTDTPQPVGELSGLTIGRCLYEATTLGRYESYAAAEDKVSPVLYLSGNVLTCANFSSFVEHLPTFLLVAYLYPGLYEVYPYKVSYDVDEPQEYSLDPTIGALASIAAMKRYYQEVGDVVMEAKYGNYLSTVLGAINQNVGTLYNGLESIVGVTPNAI
jgi:hypothetical protein